MRSAWTWGLVAALGCGGSTQTAGDQDAASAADAGPAGDDGGSGTPAVGTPCVPSEELSPTFGGFSYQEVSIERSNAGCGRLMCLVDHFQGRTTCPYGEQPGGSASCTVPGTSTPVTPPRGTVQPWCIDRLARDTVTCTCRCANADGRTDDGAQYCTCPGAMTCTQLITPGGPSDLAGAYCIPQGHAYDPRNVCFGRCDPQLAQPGCAPPR
jgi:hypothetical protein